VIHREPGRAEHRHLAALAVGAEDLEGVAQFFQGGVEQLDVAAVGLVAQQLVGGFVDLLHQLLDPDGGRGVLQRVVGVADVLEGWTPPSLTLRSIRGSFSGNRDKVTR